MQHRRDRRDIVHMIERDSGRGHQATADGTASASEALAYEGGVLDPIALFAPSYVLTAERSHYHRESPKAGGQANAEFTSGRQLATRVGARRRATLARHSQMMTSIAFAPV